MTGALTVPMTRGCSLRADSEGLPAPMYSKKEPRHVLNTVHAPFQISPSPLTVAKVQELLGKKPKQKELDW